MDLGLTGKVAIITGGSDGIGKATALRLCAEGAKVVIFARRAEHLQNAANEIREQTKGEIVAIPGDVCSAADCERLIDETARRFGRIDILFNNAGTSAGNAFEAVDDDYWRTDFETKFFAAVRLCRLALPHFRKVGGGRIVNLTHVGAKQPGAKSVPTSTSRAAGIALTKALSKEYGRENILVNTVCVGWIKSAQWERRHQREAPEMPLEDFYRERGASHAPVGRFGESEEVADLVAFLVSERARYITGVAVNIDGGASGVV
ncbi:MAG: SDR family oxidoreductase [Chloroflexi bacterium]|nr:SDR family oxidoreductase [Chloroflexota bacterium]